MRIEDVDAVATSLPGVRCSGRPGGRKWLVGGRLVVREDGPGTLVVRVGFADRERLLEQHPETFGVPPQFEKHMKMQVDLDGDAGGDPGGNPRGLEPSGRGVTRPDQLPRTRSR